MKLIDAQTHLNYAYTYGNTIKAWIYARSTCRMEQVLVVCRCFAGDFVHAYAYSHMLNHIYTHASMERPVFKASAEMH